MRNKFGKCWKKGPEEERETCAMMDQTAPLLSALFLAVHPFSFPHIKKKKT